MNSKIRQLLSPPVFDNEEQTRIARILNTLLLFFGGATILLTLAGVWVGDEQLTWALGGAAVAFGANFGLTRYGYLKAASNLVIFILLTLVVYLLVIGHGVHDNALIIFPGIMILGSLVLDRGRFVGLVLLSILSVGGVVFAEVAGFLATPYQADTNLEDFLAVGTALLITAVSVRLLANDILQNLNRVHTAQQALATSHDELQTYILELEQKRQIQERFTTQLQTAAEVAQQLTLILDPEELLNQIVTLLQARFHLYHVQVYLLDAAASNLVMRAGSGSVGRLLRQQAHHIPFHRPDSLVARTARERVILVVNDVKQEPSFLPNPVLPNTCSEATIPLLIKDRILGVLDIQEDEPGAIQGLDLNTFHILAGQIAIALENARLFSKLLQSETALREGESRYRSLFEDSPISLWENDFSRVKQEIDEIKLAEGQSWRAFFTENPTTIFRCLQKVRVLDVNQVTVRMFEAQGKGTLYSSLHQIFGVEVSDFLREQFIALANGLISFTGEATLTRLNGEKIYTLYRLIIAPGYEETWGKAFISLIDISERKKAEQALQAERDFARQVLETMGQGLTVTDINGRFEFVNPAYAQMLGYPMEKLLDKHPFDLSADQANRDILVSSWQQRKRGESNSYETRLVHADGHLIDVMINGVPRWEHGQITGSIAVITDLTEHKRAAQEREELITELEARNAELGRFTYTVSHDLKSPLVTIKGFLGMLEKDIAKGDASRIQSDIERIRAAALTMEALLNDLLELSRVGRLVNPLQEVDFASLTQEAIERVTGQMSQRGVQVVVAPDLPVVFGDRTRLVEVLQNLLDNAIKFMGEQSYPLIEVGVRKNHEEMVFYVRDNGTGILPRYHEKIFGLFERLNPAIEGTGIGLALVKRIVEVHNGRIWVESDGLHQGATFCFTLPTPARTNTSANTNF